jgi:DNA-binding MarR family transcriptional regulator
VTDRSAAAILAWESLFRAQVNVLRELNREFPTGELSFNEYDVLFNLTRHEGRKLRIRDLGKHLLLTQPSISRMVDRLAGRGLVVKERDPGDGRGTFVCLTDEGYALYRKVAVTHGESITRHVAGALSADELRSLYKLTEKLRGGVEAGLS